MKMGMESPTMMAPAHKDQGTVLVGCAQAAFGEQTAQWELEASKANSRAADELARGAEF